MRWYKWAYVLVLLTLMSGCGSLQAGQDIAETAVEPPTTTASPVFIATQTPKASPPPTASPSPTSTPKASPTLAPSPTPEPTAQPENGQLNESGEVYINGRWRAITGDYAQTVIGLLQSKNITLESVAQTETQEEEEQIQLTIQHADHPDVEAITLNFTPSEEGLEYHSTTSTTTFMHQDTECTMTLIAEAAPQTIHAPSYQTMGYILRSMLITLDEHTTQPGWPLPSVRDKRGNTQFMDYTYQEGPIPTNFVFHMKNTNNTRPPAFIEQNSQPPNFSWKFSQTTTTLTTTIAVRNQEYFSNVPEIVEFPYKMNIIPLLLGALAETADTPNRPLAQTEYEAINAYDVMEHGSIQANKEDGFYSALGEGLTYYYNIPDVGIEESGQFATIQDSNILLTP